jgi:hypothetical protein
MIGLRKVGNDHNAISSQRVQPVLECGRIGRVVPVPAVGFMQKKRDIVAIDKVTFGTTIFNSDFAGTIEFGNYGRDEVVVKGFTASDSGNIQTLLYFGEFQSGEFDQSHLHQERRHGNRHEEIIFIILEYDSFRRRSFAALTEATE